MLHRHRDSLNRIEDDIDDLKRRKPGKDLSGVCDECLHQVMARHTLSDPFSASTHKVAMLRLMPGYRACSTCADIIGTSDLDAINYSPEARDG